MVAGKVDIAQSRAGTRAGRHGDGAAGESENRKNLLFHNGKSLLVWTDRIMKEACKRLTDERHNLMPFRHNLMRRACRSGWGCRWKE